MEIVDLLIKLHTCGMEQVRDSIERINFVKKRIQVLDQQYGYGLLKQITSTVSSAMIGHKSLPYNYSRRVRLLGGEGHGATFSCPPRRDA